MAYQINLTGQEIDERLQNIGTAEDAAAADGTLYARIKKNADDIAENKENVKVLIERVDTVTGTANEAKALTKINEERLNSVQATANTALENSERNQDSVRNAQVTANEAKASVEGLTTVVRRAENNISQLKELNVVYPNNLRKLTVDSTPDEIKKSFIPEIGGTPDTTNTPHVGYLIKGGSLGASSGYGPDSTIISVEVVKIDNNDCHKFMYIDNNRDLVTMTVCIWGGTFKVIERSVVSNINTIVDKINTFDKKMSSGTLRDLYISAGAVYNEATGFYELNRLTDITEEQMRVIYKYAGTPQVKSAFAYSKARTNLPMPGMYNGMLETHMFYGCSNLETVYLGYRQVTPTNFETPSAEYRGQDAFYLCKKLKYIYGRLLIRTSNIGYTFGECLSLEEVRIYNLVYSIQISWSPNLSKESVQYMITNANPPSGAAVGSITITLHPTAYTRLKDDADIVAALEAKGGIVTLVSA